MKKCRNVKDEEAAGVRKTFTCPSLAANFRPCPPFPHSWKEERKMRKRKVRGKLCMICLCLSVCLPAYLQARTRNFVTPSKFPLWLAISLSLSRSPFLFLYVCLFLLLILSRLHTRTKEVLLAEFCKLQIFVKNSDEYLNITLRNISNTYKISLYVGIEEDSDFGTL